MKLSVKTKFLVNSLIQHFKNFTYISQQFNFTTIRNVTHQVLCIY